MRDFLGYVLIGTVAVLSMALVTIAGLGLTVGARPVVEGGAIVQHVDRTHKGDRLDLRKTVGLPALVPKPKAPVPIGCEPEFSPLVAGAPSIPGRCDS
jgi:hypothetical protein